MKLGIGYCVAFSAFFISLSFETVKCSKSAGISDKPKNIACKDNPTCATAIEGSFCDIPPGADEGTCACPSGIINDEGDRCLEGNILIGNPCEKNEQCVGYAESPSTSECLSGSSEKVCTCRDRYIHNNANTECLPIIDKLEDDFCKETVQCHMGIPGNLSNCELKSSGSPEKVCRCNPDATNAPAGSPDDLHNRCFRKAEYIGEICEIQEQCTSKLGHSRCVNKFCICNENYVNATDMTACLDEKNLGETCTDVTQCVVPFATCTLGMCTCIANYVKPIGENKCYKKSLVDQTCEISDQCPQNSHCNNVLSRCTCNADFISRVDKTGCLPIAKNLGEDCQEIAQCQRFPNSQCIVPPGSGTGRTKCTCSPGKYVGSEIQDNTCVQIVHEKNLPCNENVQCTAGLGPHALCRDGVCQCKLHYGYYNGTCHIPAKLFEPCEIVEQCYVGVNNLTVCHASPTDFQKRCQCLPGTEPVLDNRKCYDLTRKVGENCTSHEECTVSIVGEVYCDPVVRVCTCNFGHSTTYSKNICSRNGVDSYHFKSFIVPLSLLLITISGVKAIIP